MMQLQTSTRYARCSQQDASSSNPERKNTLHLSPIAYATTTFKKRTGCPRQPTLCPHTLATITLSSHCPKETIEGLDKYSYIWVVFTFDNNTDIRSSERLQDYKITPPRIIPKGTKVGCLSTRTPHRPNNIGLSLLTVNSISNRTITVTGIDLCDQTPIYDIKPYVPWDVPGYVKGGRWGGEMGGVLKCPDWVWDSEALEYLKQVSVPGYSSLIRKGSGEEVGEVENVFFMEEAIEQLNYEYKKGTFKPLYSPKKSSLKTV
ncbi:hypothetical protein TL16_g06754 [Triparma laevis f. inornata]|uniref:TsaA-like domain-containing protein n=2 Tax=Triparma laevis TaxID=1534972 RepID=A0A9W7FA36_9STRA|nr:hypothetical protein TL16_g06754 [Triparma laevis f. inornata]GMI06788.1 hypothetical protein TrLO_g8062 [Triparma laevis f. longispina]